MTHLVEIITAHRMEIAKAQNMAQQGLLDWKTTELFKNYEKWHEILEDLDEHVGYNIVESIEADYAWLRPVVSKTRQRYIDSVHDMYMGGVE